MTPAPPPKDDSIDVNDVFSEAPENEALDTDNLDADFEQELEDLFSDDLEEEQAAADEADEGADEPIVLDDLMTAGDDLAEDDDLLVLDEVADVAETADDDLLVLDEVADEAADDDLLVLDDVADEASDDDLLVLDEVVADDVDGDDVAALVDDIAEDNTAAPAADGDDEDIIELDDLLEEGAEAPELDSLLEGDDALGLDDDALVLDDIAEAPGDEPELLLEETVDDEPELLLDDVADEVVEDEISLGSLADEDASDDALADGAEEIFLEDEDAGDAAMAEAAESDDLPVDAALSDDELSMLMDEPEPTPAVSAADDGGLDIAELAGMERLDDDGPMDDMESLLDNVEVDVSDIMDESDDDAELDLPDLDVDDVGVDSVSDMITAEAMPEDAGVALAPGEDVDQFMADVRTESVPDVAALQAKVASLEARVEDLEHRLREEIAQLVPAEAARIIREEIEALARELDD